MSSVVSPEKCDTLQLDACYRTWFFGWLHCCMEAAGNKACFCIPYCSTGILVANGNSYPDSYVTVTQALTLRQWIHDRWTSTHLENGSNYYMSEWIHMMTLSLVATTTHNKPFDRRDESFSFQETNIILLLHPAQPTLP